jgi:hypothetical protein
VDWSRERRRVAPPPIAVVDEGASWLGVAPPGLGLFESNTAKSDPEAAKAAIAAR